MLDFFSPLGPCHLLVLHLPIGGFVALWFAWLARSKPQQYVYAKSFLTLNLFLLLTTVLSVATGWLYRYHGGYGDELDWHELAGYLFAALVSLQFVVLILLRRRASVGLKWVYYLLFLFASAAMVVTSHLGGELVHGKGFVKKAFRQKVQMPETSAPLPAIQLQAIADTSVPQTVERGQHPLRPFQVATEPSDATSNQNDARLSSTSVASTTNDELGAQAADRAFDPFAPLVASDSRESDLIQPPSPQVLFRAAETEVIRTSQPLVQQVESQWTPASAELSYQRFNRAARVLKNHCYSCHGATKVKGGLRLDRKEFAMTAGDSGEVSIIPYNAQSSLLITRMRLPQTHDDVMPPSSRAPVDVDGIRALMAWIDAGAVWDSDIVWVPDQQPAHNDVRAQPAQAALALEALTQAGIPYQRMGWDDPRIRVNLSSQSSEDLAQKIQTLLTVKERVIWLDLSQSSLSQELAEQLVAFENLERLKLMEAQFGDEVLQKLTALKALTYLNLYQSNVTDSAMETLSQIVNLRKVFLAESLVTPAGVERLRSLNSALKIVYR